MNPEYALIADTAANKEAIIHIKEDVAELKEDVQALGEKMDGIIRRLDSNSNQILGASKLAKILWFAFPTLCAAFGWVVGMYSK
jgi:hypothetical protein